MLNINTKLNHDNQPKIELALELANLPGNNSKIQYLVPWHYSKSSNVSISVFEYPGLGIAAAVEDNNQKIHILTINHIVYGLDPNIKGLELLNKIMHHKNLDNWLFIYDEKNELIRVFVNLQAAGRNGLIAGSGLRFPDSAQHTEILSNALNDLASRGHLNSFRGAITVETLDHPLTVYRYQRGKDDFNSNFWSITPPSGPTQHALDSAMHPKIFKDVTFISLAGDHVSTAVIPKGTIIYSGFTSSQYGFQGGGSQIYIPGDWSKKAPEFEKNFEVKTKKDQEFFSKQPTSSGSSQQNFKDSVKTSGLTESYNSNHPESQIENPGQKGSPTGGVESYVGIIKGLLNSTAHLFEQEHWFAFKGEDGQPPFTEGELQQIIRELAYAIYVHDTVPFFSLHFNNNGTMYPVIHPAYENTLVGRVISMLDYFMKGYLNGGFFNEDNIDNWNEALNYDGLNSRFIAMHQYCVDKLPNSKYISLRHMMDLYHINQYQKELGEAGESIMAKNKFQISFRIIAKQDGIEKVDRLFVFTPAFEVQYTIEIQDSGYQAYIAEHKAKHGEVPAEMKMLEQLCTQVARDIETTMPKLPICRDYFHMLGVINALSYYFKTLKLMKKVPLLPRAEPAKTTCCPSIFPPLPVEHLKAIKIPFDLAKIAAKLNPELKQQLNQAIAKQIGREAINIPGINIPGYLTTDLITAFKAALPLDFLIPADAIILGMIKNIFDLLWDKLKVLKPQLHLAYSSLADLGLKELTSMQKINAKEDRELELLETQRRELLQKMSKSEEKNLEEMQNQAKQSHGYRYNYMMENLIKNQSQQYWQEQRSKLEALIQEDKNSKKREAENERNRIKGVCAQLRQAYNATIDKLVIMINTPLNSKELTEDVSFELSGRQRIVKVQTEAERINEEQWLTVKIHGGCGLNLSNQVAVATPVAEQLFNISYQNMQDAIQEKWLATTHQNSTYYSFKLPIANFFAADNSDYEWLGNSLVKDVRLTNEADAELQSAISLQDTPQIQQLLKAGKIDTKAYNEEGRTALHLAVLSNNLASVTALIKYGFNVSQGDKNGLTALHLAAQLGYVDMAEKLYQAQATTLEMQTKHKATALYLAVQHGQFEVVKLLVGYGANVNTPIHNSLFPLYIAIYNEHYAIASFLLSTSKVDPQAKVTDESTALHLAVQLDLADLVEQMFKLGFDIAAKRRDGMSPLHLAVKNSNLAIATALIDAVRIAIAKDPKRKITHSSLVNQTTNSGLTPLHIACEQSDVGMAELLLKNGANPNLITVDEKNALMHAIEAGQHQLALMMVPLTDLHAVNGDKDTVLMLACQYNLMDLAYLLVETNKFKISQLDSNGWGYIHYLARRSDITHLEILLKKQPRLFTETTQNGLTILDIALMHGHTALVSELQLQQLIKTVDYFRVLPNGWNYIQLAAKHGLIDVVTSYLAQENVDIEYKSPRTAEYPNSGKSLVYLATEYRQVNIMKLLLKHGASQTNCYKDHHLLYAAVESGEHTLVRYLLIQPDMNANMLIGSNMTCGEVAAQRGDVTMLKYLRKYGAKLQLANPETKRYAVEHAIAAGHKKVIKFFLDSSYKFGLEEVITNSLIHYGREDLLTEVVNKLQGFILEYVNQNGENFLFAAINQQKPAVLRLLLSLGLNPNQANFAGEYPLHLAITKHSEECLEVLLAYQARPQLTNNAGQDAFSLAKDSPLLLAKLTHKSLAKEKQDLITAIEDNNLSQLKQLVARLGIQVKVYSPTQQAEVPLLQLAILLNREALMEWLLQNGANINQLSSNGEGVIHSLARSGNPELMTKLLKQYALNVHAKNNLGFQAIHLAVITNNPEIINLLSQYEASLNAEAQDGITPIILAMQLGYYELIDTLLSSPAIINYINNQRISPLYFAVNDGNLFLVKNYYT